MPRYQTLVRIKHYDNSPVIGREVSVDAPRVRDALAMVLSKVRADVTKTRPGPFDLEVGAFVPDLQAEYRQLAEMYRELPVYLFYDNCRHNLRELVLLQESVDQKILAGLRVLRAWPPAAEPDITTACDYLEQFRERIESQLKVDPRERPCVKADDGKWYAVEVTARLVEVPAPEAETSKRAPTNTGEDA